MKKLIALILSLTFVLVLVGCGKAENNTTPNTPNALVPAVMYDGEIYCTTEKQIPAEVDESAIVGEVTSVVPLSQWPNEEGQANFGQEGMALAVTSSGFLVLVEDEWTLFELRDNEESKLIYGSTYDPNADNSEDAVNGEGARRKEGLSLMVPENHFETAPFRLTKLLLV